jgi:hypothetical protein
MTFCFFINIRLPIWKLSLTFYLCNKYIHFVSSEGIFLIKLVSAQAETIKIPYKYNLVYILITRIIGIKKTEDVKVRFVSL